MSEDSEAPIEAAPYYWETSSTEDVGWSTKVWHWTHWTGDKIFTGMEFGGEVVATFLGLTRSKYDWILETKERDEHEKLLRQLEKRQRKQLRLQELLEEEKKKLNELEHGSNTEKPADILL
ncbi:unnamed protein product [Aphanomyces euteiches]|uniref:Uncharacterized protein n=1 Tax=Aphanomyces euteiches TaxID=100861 RepID=A0A6G0XJZ9_9STRA|nr:hypothetical protein Ae201684_004195 [Aphanomyces euteiches]KAH9094202.1 hypothetical protein Ae201684P_016814 [Aphanomyces euteiches]